MWEHPDGADERFLYLPALGRVRRIAGEEKQESFVGSDLSYEDIGGRDVADYGYAFASENAAWTAPDGTRHAAWALESRAKDKDAEFPRSVSIVLKDYFVVGARRYLQPPRRTSEGVRRQAAGARGRHLERA